MANPHLAEIANELYPLKKDMEILLLIGLPQTPYAQRLGLGWVVVGEVCLGKSHRPETVFANKVTILLSGITALCDPCPSNIAVKEMPCIPEVELIGDSIFQTTDQDDQSGLSIDDKLFLSMMDR
jgi:hypothetical protein